MGQRVGELSPDSELWTDFLSLCDFGGRLTGSAGEIASRDWAAGRLAAIPGGRLTREPRRYDGWTCSACRLLLTRHDRRDMATPADFDEPMRAAGATLHAALTAPSEALAALRMRGS